CRRTDRAAARLSEAPEDPPRLRPCCCSWRCHAALPPLVGAPSSSSSRTRCSAALRVLL
ncbi:hypothetical protein Dimus_022783, partial [Dionaea muscipula]